MTKPLSDALPQVWLVWGDPASVGPDVAFTVEYSAHEHANIMAAEHPELGPWRVRRYVDAAGFEAGRATVPEHNWRKAAYICDRCREHMPSMNGCAMADCQARPNDAATGQTINESGDGSQSQSQEQRNGQPASSDQGLSGTIAAGNRLDEQGQGARNRVGSVGGGASQQSTGDDAGSTMGKHRSDSLAGGVDGLDASGGAADILLTPPSVAPLSPSSAAPDVAGLERKLRTLAEDSGYYDEFREAADAIERLTRELDDAVYDASTTRAAHITTHAALDEAVAELEEAASVLDRCRYSEQPAVKRIRAWLAARPAMGEGK